MRNVLGTIFIIGQQTTDLKSCGHKTTGRGLKSGREGGGEIKSCGQRTHSGRIWIFWFRNSQTKIEDLRSDLRLCWIMLAVADHCRCIIHYSVCDREANTGRVPGWGGKKGRPHLVRAIHHIYIHFRLTTFPPPVLFLCRLSHKPLPVTDFKFQISAALSFSYYTRLSTHQICRLLICSICSPS